MEEKPLQKSKSGRVIGRGMSDEAKYNIKEGQRKRWERTWRNKRMSKPHSK